jgi:hypothetical protein
MKSINHGEYRKIVCRTSTKIEAASLQQPVDRQSIEATITPQDRFATLEAPLEMMSYTRMAATASLAQAGPLLPRVK